MTSTSRPVKIGVIGCGTIAFWAHLRTLRRLPGARLAAVADTDPAARERIAHLVQGRIYNDTSELLASDVEAVVISTPTATHAELAIAAARAGKHIYIEKPIATTTEDARNVADCVQRSRGVAAVGFNYRFHPAHVRGRTLLRQGQIGRIRAVHTAFCEPVSTGRMPAWKRRRCTGGGVLLDLASHHIDLLRWFLDDEINSVEAAIRSTETEHDAASLKLETVGGTDIQMFLSFRAAAADYLEFFGDRGTLRVDRHRVTPVLHISRRSNYGVRRAWIGPSASDVAVWTRRLVRPSYQPSFSRALAAFLDRVSGHDVVLPTVEDGERSLAVVLAAEESSMRRAPVTVLG